MYSWKRETNEMEVELFIEREPLHPIGCLSRNSDHFPILYGGKAATFSGHVTIRSLVNGGYHASMIIASIEEVLLKEREDHKEMEYLNKKYTDVPCDSVIFGIEEYSFSIPDFVGKYDSYDGISNHIMNQITISIEHNEAIVFQWSIPFYIRYPMPIPPLLMSYTSSQSIFDVLTYSCHLNKIVYTVNDIITGFIEIKECLQSFEDCSIALVRRERCIDKVDHSEESSMDVLCKQQIMDTIMRKKKDIPTEAISPSQLEEQVIQIRGASDHQDSAPSFDAIPFRMYINEWMGVCPNYSMINDELSVDWAFRVIVRDKSLREYYRDVDIQIYRGDILCIT